MKKRLQKEFPKIGLRDSVSGKEAYVLGHRVAVWEIVDVQRETNSDAKTAAYFGWPVALVRCALEYGRAFPAEIAQQRAAEVGAL